MNLECAYCNKKFPNEESLDLHKTAVSFYCCLTNLVLHEVTKFDSQTQGYTAASAEKSS